MNRLKLSILFLLLSIGAIYCQTQNTLRYSINDSLAIEGNGIWIRSKPMTGKVVFKLNEGSTCRVLEKGNKQSIGTTTDYWYLISFENLKGWVFGSQTSMKQGETSPDFETYLRNFLDKHFFGVAFDYRVHNSQAKNLKHIDIGYFRLYNPGILCQLEPYKLSENYNKEQEPNMPEATYFENQMPKDGFCDKSKSPDGIYFKEVEKFPSYTIFSNEYENKAIELPLMYKRGKKMKVVVLHNSMIIKTLYFIAADNNWSLVIIDDCDCSS
ncbi:SH3 domain-containing protein [Flavivirga algicola]|uniref:SH3 domain-containing protein n=1 Tax=Flavivirga algicola TaxID=2729136 RepID=A0ABX1S3M3_9FLAO|nr:hypothetical protein [Flavivirga algicola]NMH89668.1 hypothetical protein [Flavivirga algicola]